jgi:regulator of replication initiation timing
MVDYMENNVNLDEIKDRIKSLNDKLKTLQAENERLKAIIIENDLADEVGVQKVMTVEEEICVSGLSILRQLFINGSFVKDDVTAFDVLHKNLRLIRGLDTGDKKKKNEKPADVKELLRIVESDIKETNG